MEVPRGWGRGVWGGHTAADLSQCQGRHTPCWRKAALKDRGWQEAPPVSRAEMKQKLCFWGRLLCKVQKVWKAALQWRILESASKSKMSTRKGSGKCQAGVRSLAGPEQTGEAEEVWPHRGDTEGRKRASPLTAGPGATESPSLEDYWPILTQKPLHAVSGSRKTQLIQLSVHVVN